MGGGIVVEDLGAVANIDLISSRTFAPVQFGQYNTVSGIWGTSAGQMNLSATILGGIVYDLYNRDSAGHITNAFGVEAITIQLSFAQLTGFTRIGQLISYVTDDPTPSDFTSANPPANTTARAVGASIYTTANDNNRRTDTLDTIASGETETTLYRVIKDPLWNGRIALSFFWASAFQPVVFAAGSGASQGNFNLIVRTWSGHTGRHGSTLRRARAVHGYKSGMPVPSDEFLRDGYLEGTTVHMSEWDPVDPGPTFVPPTGEGLVSDDITDIES